MPGAGTIMAPVRSLARRFARASVQGDAERLVALESVIAVGAGGRVPGIASPEMRSRLPHWLRIGLSLDRDGVVDALRRGHYRAIRAAPEPVWRTFDFAGFTVTHDIRNKSQWNAYMRGVHQPGVMYWLQRAASPGACALDIGANAGVVSLELVRAVGEQGRVHAFEPNPAAYALLDDAVARNGLGGRLLVYHCALGSEDAVMPLAIPAENNGAASLCARDTGDATIEVRVRRFDAWWREQGECAIHLIKLDVEGFEASVVASLRAMLMRDRPTLVMELSPDRYDAQALLGRLAELGYQVHRVTDTEPFFSPLPAVIRDQTDIVCLPSGCSD